VKAQNSAGCFSSDTISIRVNHSNAILLGNDTSLCFNQSFVLDAGGGFSSYKWSNGIAQQSITVSIGGNYSVKGTTTQGCSSYDTINILVRGVPVVSLDDNPVLCVGSSRTLNAGNYADYTWQNGSKNSTFIATGIGTYFVDVVDAFGCKGSDTTKITRIGQLPSAFLPADTLICSYSPLSLQANKLFKTYLWSTSQTSPVIQISQPGLYWLQVKDSSDCVGADSIIVGLKQCSTGLFVPTAFTPNHDNRNDQLHAFLFGDIQKFHFSIYNRFGQVVFQSTDPAKGWDGKINGIEQGGGTYVWTCSYQLANSSERLEKGTTVLIR
jgi:gliding motility-associated-like protein